MLSFVWMVAAASAVVADPGMSEPIFAGREVALETVVGRAAPMLIKAAVDSDKSRKISEGLTASERLGNDLGKMFQEGAAKLDAPSARNAGENIEVAGWPEGGRSVTVQAYSYCLSGHTASGRPTARGCVAVDTRVIPMGSKLFIPGYGWAVAADTGGAIMGNTIDVWFPTLGQCYQWGVRSVTIKVFPKG